MSTAFPALVDLAPLGGACFMMQGEYRVFEARNCQFTAGARTVDPFPNHDVPT